MTTTAEQLKAGLDAIRALADTIRHLKRVPSGVLYARLMGSMDLRQYESMIRLLKDSGLVREVNHELIWIGPKREQNPKAHHPAA